MDFQKIIKEKKVELIFSFIILLFFTLKLIQSFNIHNVIWDESIYIGMGKYIYSNGASGIWDMIRPILLSVIIGFSYLFTDNIIQISEIITILFAIGNIILVYLISKKITNKHIALFSSVLLISIPIFYLFSSFILTNIPSTFFTLLATFYFLEKKYIHTGIITAFAFLTRFPQGLLLICFFIIIFINSKLNIKSIKDDIIKKYLPLGLSFLITIIPYFILNYFMYIDREKSFIKAILSPLILGSIHQKNTVNGTFDLLGSVLYYPNFLFAQSILFGLIFIGIFFLIKNKDYKKFKINSIFVISFIYFLYYSYIPNKQERFFLTIIPYLVILIGYTLYSIKNIINKKYINYFNLGLIIIFIISILTSTPTLIKTMNGEYEYWYKPNPEIKINHYTSFKEEKVNGYILTVDPIFTAYDNNLYKPYLPYYENDIEYFNNEVKNAEIIILSDDVFNHFTLQENDIRIRDTNKIINDSFIEIEKESFFSDKYKIYKKK